MKKIDLEQYINTLKDFLKLQKSGDNEASHIFQDDIYRTFIKDICFSKKFESIDDIKKIAFLINNNVIKHDKNRWYT